MSESPMRTERADGADNRALSTESHRDPVLLQRNVILLMLLAFATAAWALVVWHDHNSIGMTMAPAAIGSHVTLFVAMWAIMMMAMMFPSAAPMILAFHKAQADKHQPDDAFLSTWLFVAAYLLVWWGFAVYAGALAAGASGMRTAANTPEVSGLILMSAGLYQLTPLKEFCLSKCRTPMDFIVTSWVGGPSGAFHMGLVHGLYCLGCYWMLFLILFPLGMSIAAMAAVALVILAEKTLPRPQVVTYATAVVLVIYGAMVTVTPQLLPTFRQDGRATMPAEMPTKMPTMQ